MRSKSLYLASIAVFLVLGLPGILWIGFPALAPLLAAPLLEARGLELLRLETERPGLSGLTVESLQLADAAAGLSLLSDDVRIVWGQPLRGIRDGLTSVVIGRMEVVYDPPKATASPGDDPGSAATTPAALLASLPTRELEITAFAASGRIAGQVFEAAGSLRASPNDAHFSGILRTDALPAPVAIRAQLRPDEQINLRVDTAEESGPFLIVDGALKPPSAGPAFTGAARLDLDRIQSWLDAPAPWPSGFLDLQLAVALDPEPLLTIAATSTGRIQLAHDEVALALKLALLEPLGVTYSDDRLIFATGSLPMQIEARRDAWAMAGTFDLAAVEIGEGLDASARLTGTGEASWPDGGSAFTIDLPLRARLTPPRLQLASRAELLLADIRHAATGLAELSVKSRAPVDLDAGGLLGSAEFDVVTNDPGRLELSAQVRVSPTGDLDVEVDEASLPLSDNDLLAMILPAHALARSGRLHVEGRLRRSHLGILDATLQTRWQNAGFDLPEARVRGASGDARLAYSSKQAGGRLDIASARTTLDRLEWIGAEGPQTVILLDGLEALGSGSLEAGFGSGLELGNISMSSELTAEGIARGEISAEAIKVDARLSGDVRQPKLEGRLRVASADLGVPVKEVSCGFHTGDFEAWQLSDCSAAVLGGDVRLPKGDFNLDTGSGYLPLAVTGMQLGAVLGLMQDPALDGSGTLDGSLPLRMKAMQPVLEQGWLAVRPPGGMLAYVTAANVLAGIEQPALRLTLRALQDLRYQRLESRVDYSEEGTLTLTVDLLGSNPEIEGGRPIQLNLNVTQNLLELLQSLRFSDNIEQELQRRMQRVQP